MTIYRTQHNKENPYVCINKSFLDALDAIESYGLNPTEYRVFVGALWHEAKGEEWSWYSFDQLVPFTELRKAWRVLVRAELIGFPDGVHGQTTPHSQWESVGNLDSIREQVTRAIASSQEVRL